MKSKGIFFVVALSFLLANSGQAIADSTTQTRPDQIASIQAKYNPIFDAEYARILVVKTKHPADAYVLLNIDIILKDFLEVRRVIDTAMLSDTSDLDAMDSYADEETGEFQVTITNLEQLALTRTTINCVKGKVSKKVSGVKPKCPTGYKKK